MDEDKYSFRNIKLPHSRSVFLAYPNINSAPNRISNIPYLTENNLGIFAIAETKIAFLFFMKSVSFDEIEEALWMKCFQASWV